MLRARPNPLPSFSRHPHGGAWSHFRELIAMSLIVAGCASATVRSEEECIRNLTGTWEMRWVRYRMVIVLSGTHINDLMLREARRVVVYRTVGDACHLRIVFPNPYSPVQQFTIDSRDGVFYAGEFRWSPGYVSDPLKLGLIVD